MKPSLDSFQVCDTLHLSSGHFRFFSLPKLSEKLNVNLSDMPFSMRILLENLLRKEDGEIVTRDDIRRFCSWKPDMPPFEIPFYPARVLLQDFTGVPAVVDLAAMRDAAQQLFGNPLRINPVIPAELVIDHSVQIDAFGTPDAFGHNCDREFERNAERYRLLKWGQRQLRNFSVIPPATGICHQVNLEFLARVVFTHSDTSGFLAYPDTVVGLDSHTTMINGLGVLGWGVGGIEAEAVMLGAPYYMLIPKVTGFRLKGNLPDNVTATDLVLTITQMLRKAGVVGQFVEFFGPGLDNLRLEDRATIANMAPEYGATAGFFPIDRMAIDYLSLTHRTDETIQLVETYFTKQEMFSSPSKSNPVYSRVIELDMADVVPCLAGPKRPQERLPLIEVKTMMETSLHSACTLPSPEPEATPSKSSWELEGGKPLPKAIEPSELAICEARDLSGVPIEMNGNKFHLDHGAVVIAAITSCTNTSNPRGLITAGLLARKAVQAGLQVKPWVKTSFAPGSRAATAYLDDAGLLKSLEALSFHVAAYGCTTCIGNSGPLAEPIAQAIETHDIVVASVLSGNRNFEGRIHPLTKANFLASPALVVAFALAGTVRIDLIKEPIAVGIQGVPIYLRDIWPTPQEIDAVVQGIHFPRTFAQAYTGVFDGSDQWRHLHAPDAERYPWESGSTYIQEPPFFQTISDRFSSPVDITGARVLAFLGDSVTTDHISPAGSIPKDSPAGMYLMSMGIPPEEFNSYGARRGNHHVMMRGTFANIRLQNKLVPEIQGGFTRFLPSGEVLTIYEAAMRYGELRTPLVILAGKEYGTGSSRDWAAKGTMLLGVRAVLAKSFERIHRSNLVCMGVLPLEFLPEQDASTLGLDGTERFDISGIASMTTPRSRLRVTAIPQDAPSKTFEVIARLDSPIEIVYYRHGGILPYVLRTLGEAGSPG
ncbi:MAG: aconitate hydratase [Thermodesulfobacteriota bacterium]